VAKQRGEDGRSNNRPPVSGQFKPGQSGYPPGRPKGSRNHRTELDDQLKKTVAVTENGKRVRKKKWAVIIAQQINKAMAGDLKAAQFITEQMIKYGLLVEGDNEPTKLTTDEASVFEDVVRRIHAAEATTRPADPLVNERSEKAPLIDKDKKP
jgi:hypothetical protein